MVKHKYYSQLWYPAVLELLSVTIFVLTACIAQATFTLSSILGYTVDSGSVLTLLSIFQGLQSIMVTAILFGLFEILHWVLMARDIGLPSISAIGLSPTTGPIGALRVLFSRCSELPDRLWPLLRLVLTIVLWVSGVILFADTSVDVTYRTAFTYPVTAGIGQFNGSYVRSFIDLLQGREEAPPYIIMPYSIQAIVYNLVVNPMHSVAGVPVPVGACTDNACDSYLFPGGLIGATPWPPTNHSSAPVIQIDDAPAVQLDFSSGLNGHSFSGNDCTLFGANTTYVGINFCVAASNTLEGSFAAGVYVCPEGVYEGECSLGNSTFYPNLTTTFTVFNRKTTFIASRSNMSILSVTHSSEYAQDPTLNIETFRTALSWLLDFNASSIPAPTSIAQQFWSGQGQMENTYWSPELKQTFHSLLAFPLWAFNANSIGNPDAQVLREINPNLPPEFYTTATVASPYYRIMINNVMFSVFIGLQGVLHLFIWAVLAWLCVKSPALPVITSFPLFDFAFKTRYTRRASVQAIEDQKYQIVPQSLLEPKILEAGNGEVISSLKQCTHFVRRSDSVLLAAEHGASRVQSLQQTSISSVSVLLPG
ncbi:hypothetical protein BDV19DRAFT_395148 [Aspergillus venezuelensis]